MGTGSIVRETNRLLPLPNNSWITLILFPTVRLNIFKTYTTLYTHHRLKSADITQLSRVGHPTLWWYVSLFAVSSGYVAVAIWLIRKPTADDVTYICILVGSDGNELRLREDKRLSFRGRKGILRSILFHLHNVKTWLVFMKRLQHYHLFFKQCSCQRDNADMVWCYIFNLIGNRNLCLTTTNVDTDDSDLVMEQEDCFT